MLSGEGKLHSERRTVPSLQFVLHKSATINLRAKRYLPYATVLLLGETGTGKELIAKAVHNASTRKGKLMIKVNCAAMPASLIESSPLCATAVRISKALPGFSCPNSAKASARKR